MALILVSHYLHCSTDVFGFIVCILAMCDDEYDLDLQLREWATAMIIAP